MHQQANAINIKSEDEIRNRDVNVNNGEICKSLKNDFISTVSYFDASPTKKVSDNQTKENSGNLCSQIHQKSIKILKRSHSLQSLERLLKNDKKPDIIQYVEKTEEKSTTLENSKSKQGKGYSLKKSNSKIDTSTFNRTPEKYNINNCIKKLTYNTSLLQNNEYNGSNHEIQYKNNNNRSTTTIKLLDDKLSYDKPLNNKEINLNQISQKNFDSELTNDYRQYMSEKKPRTCLNISETKNFSGNKYSTMKSITTIGNVKDEYGQKPCIENPGS